jgi:cephalosporin hydroxylase
MGTPVKEFEEDRMHNVKRLGSDDDLKASTLKWMLDAGKSGNYVYNFDWLGRPIIQYPQDIVGLQELIWKVKPDLIIEAGVAHGGSVVFTASMLAMLDMCEAIEAGQTIDPSISSRKVIGIDIDIRAHNRALIEAHPMASRIQLIEGSSIAPETISLVKEAAVGYKNIMVILDSNHTHDHVLNELLAYANLVSVGNYCIVYDTLIDDMPDESIVNRDWGKGNSPKSAVHAFMASNDDFELRPEVENKLLITVAPDGFLQRVK